MISKFLIQSNIWVALCFTALVIYFQLNLYHPIYSVWGIAFFGTLAIYNFTRIGDWRNHFHKQNKLTSQALLTLIGCIGALICVIIRGFEIKTFLYLAVLGFVSFCYSLPFSGLGLRTIPFLKLFLIAFVWAGSSIGLLFVVHHDLLKHEFLFLSVFLFVIGITIPFDIRDQLLDEKSLKTIPQVIGVNNSKILAISCLVLSAVLFLIEIPITSPFGLSWLLSIFIANILVGLSHPHRKETYYSFWIEATSLLPLAIYFLLHCLEN